jgi:predicted RND superfamily exporter protein
MNTVKIVARQAPATMSAGHAAAGIGQGSALERLIFNHRPILLAMSLLITLGLSLSIHNMRLNASFESVIPTHQPDIVNYLDNQENLRGLGNTLNIVVAADHGGILNKNYIQTLQKINDAVFLLPGVDRSYMQSLWTPAVRWVAVTTNGAEGGPVMPMGFDGSPQSISQLADNIAHSGQIGTLVAPDFRSSLIRVPLLDIDADTGKPLDYGDLARRLDHIRDTFASQGVTLHITGFAMIVGDLIKGMKEIAMFFAISVVVTTAMVFWFTRCLRSTALVVLCSMLAVYWQLGVLAALGYGLDPYSILVPFLVFAIGMSHGSQKMNGVMQDIGRGSARLVAARMTFRRLFVAGFTALVCDAVGFAVLMTIQIQAIRELAIAASLGVAILIFTNLILLPVLLSYVGVSPRAARRSLAAEENAAEGGDKHPIWAMLDLFTQRRYAVIAILAAVAITIAGFAVGRHVQVGDIAPGAPELRGNSVYNQDNAYFVSHYAASSDVFVVMAKTPPGMCSDYNVLAAMDQLEQNLQQLPGVISTSSMVGFEKLASVQLNEGSFAWYDLLPDQPALNEVVRSAPRSVIDPGCDFMTVSVFLHDHKSTTLTAVLNTVTSFAATHNNASVTFMPAAGNAGIAAATNLVVAHANLLMLGEVYLAVILLSLITFRSWRAVLAAILPLAVTSILAQALMVWLGIGVKVATLPVTALGVGIGVDYALYILSVTLANMRAGMALSEAYYRALLFTGKVVMLTGFTLAAAVFAWAFSPIKFQADMGELLAFMFLWNMLGALVLLPALASFLLPAKLFTRAPASEARK